MNLAQSSLHIVSGLALYVHGDGIGARFQKTRHEMVWPLDHQMDVERKLGLLADTTYHDWAERDVVDEVAVHDVAVDPIRAGLGDATDLFVQTGKIGREDRRS